MLGAQLCFPTVSAGIASLATDQPTGGADSLFPSIGSFWLHFSVVGLGFRPYRCRRPKSLFISCRSSRDHFGSRSSNYDDLHRDYLQASLLVTETISHYLMRKQGFQEDMNFQSSNQSMPFTLHPNESRVNFYSLAQGLFHRFQSPTIFLKISCDGDFVLPIIVGEFAIEKLIEGQRGTESGDSPDQFQFVKDLVEKLGYEVTMVRITERVASTYFARLYFSKPGENCMLSVDARPSDAINVANRSKVPIYVNKQIVFTDAIRIGYGVGRMRDKKCTYDVSLDSATDGPDLLSEELDMVKNMKLAIQEERYKDAAKWRDKLVKLRKSIRGY